MGRVGRGLAAATLLLGAAACGSSSGPALTIASYASGTWTCASTLPSLGGTQTVTPTAIVTAASATSGRVTIKNMIPSAAAQMFHVPTTVGGAWSLRSGELMVQWDRHDMGTLQAKPISLDTKQFQIRSGVPGAAKWSTVKVNRAARSVTFDYPVAITAQGQQATMTCRKV